MTLVTRPSLPRRQALSRLARYATASATGLTLLACSKEESGTVSQVTPAGPAIVHSVGDKVEFKFPDNPAFDLVFLADQLGYFEGTSTRPRYIGRVAAPQIIPLVGTGEIDFGTRMVPLVISAVAAGADLKVVAAGGKTLEEAPHMKYFVRKDSGIRTPKDLEGKTIGFNSFGACAEFVTKTYLRQQGVDVNKINWIVVPDNQNEQTLETGNVDLAIIHPPHSGGASVNPQLLKLWSDYDLDGGLGGMAPYSAHGRFIREHPEATRDVVSAIAKAANWANANPDDARKLISERIKIALEKVERYAYIENLVITEPPIQYYIDILENEGKIAKGKVSVKDIYTNAFNPHATATAST